MTPQELILALIDAAADGGHRLRDLRVELIDEDKELVFPINRGTHNGVTLEGDTLRIEFRSSQGELA